MRLYIHIPFCDTKCAYCGFNSFAGALDSKDSYLKALNLDLARSLRDISHLDSVFIGGGTPNVLKPKDFESIFKILSPLIDKNTEITMECNPNARDRFDLDDFIKLGVNRFSIGAQSFFDDKLKILGRTHNKLAAQEFIAHAVKLAKNVSIDLIYDVNLDTRERLKTELEIADSLGIGHISCYCLSIDENSLFYKFNKNPTRENSLCYELKSILEDFGFIQYEVSNFAKTHTCAHNLGYWKYDEYIGAGLGAVGKVGKQRFYKHADLAQYIENPLFFSIENLSKNDIKMEKIFLGLRSIIGVDLDLINESKLNFVREKVSIKNKKVFSKNFFVADEVALKLI